MSDTNTPRERRAPHVALTAGRDLVHAGGESLPWLWEPYLAFGAVSVLDGDPGTGKSLLTIDLAARLGTGRPLPDGAPPARNPFHGKESVCTTFVNAEDAVRTTILPRLLAAGGDPGSVAFLGGLGEGGPDSQHVLFPYDYPLLDSLFHARPGSLVVLDPMMALFPSCVAANNDQLIREVLTPLVRMAAESCSCVLLVRHLNKSGAGRSLYRGSGSIGIVGTCRTALLAARHPDDPDRRVLAMTKSNYGPLGVSLGYRVRVEPERRVEWRVRAGEVHPHTGEVAAADTTYPRTLPAAPVVEWDGFCAANADDLCSAKPDHGASGRAAAWLRQLLANGPVAACTVESLAHCEGYGYRTVQKAKAKLQVESRRGKDADGAWRWEWALPEVAGG